MKKMIFLFLASHILDQIPAIGQLYHAFPDSNFVWNYRLENYTGGQCGTEEYVKLTIEGDTIIGSNLYHTLYYSSTTYHYPMAPSYCSGIVYTPKTFCDIIRQDTSLKKVFRYDTASHTDVVLIDFDLSLGQAHPITPLMADSLVYVKSIDSVLLGNNQYHKRFNFAYIDSTDNLFCYNSASVNVEYFSLIEGVGYTRGFNYGADWNSEAYILLHPDCDGLWGRANLLYCFGETGQAWGQCENATGYNYKDSVYSSSPSAVCDITLYTPLEKSMEWEVYPNPTSDIMYIKLPGLPKQPYQLTITNMQGKTVAVFMLNEINNTLPISGLPPGMYILQIEHNERIVKMMKL